MLKNGDESDGRIMQPSPPEASIRDFPPPQPRVVVHGSEVKERGLIRWTEFP